MIVVMLAFVVLFVAGAMAQEVTVDAGANVGESGEDTQSPADNLPTLDLEAGMTEGQPQSQAGPQGPASERGEDGKDGAPGENGHNGHDGHDGRPGRDADPRVAAKMVLAELEKSQRGETPAGWAKPYLDALKAEKLVVGYPDGTIRPKENADFERVVTVVGRVQQQLLRQLVVETQAREGGDQRNLLYAFLCVALLGVIVAAAFAVRDNLQS